LDCCEDEVCAILEQLQPTKFTGSKWSIKLDQSTDKGEFSRYGIRNVSKGIYKVCKHFIQKLHKDKDGRKHFEIVEGRITVEL